MDILEALKYVGSGLSLVAFVVAAVLLAYRARLTNCAEIIKSAPEPERLEAIATTAEFFRVDVAGLPPEQQREIALKQIQARTRRDLMLASVMLVVAVLLAIVAVIAIVGVPTRSADITVNPIRGVDFRPLYHGDSVNSNNSSVAVTVPVEVLNSAPQSQNGSLKSTTVDVLLSNKTYKFTWFYFVTLLPGTESEASWLSRNKVKSAVATDLKSGAQFAEEIMHVPLKPLSWPDFVDAFRAAKDPVKVTVNVDLSTGTKPVICQFDPTSYKPYIEDYGYISAVCDHADHP